MTTPNGVHKSLNGDNPLESPELFPEEDEELIDPQADHYKILTIAYIKLVLSSYTKPINKLSEKLGFQILNNEAIKWIFYLLIELGYFEAVYGAKSSQYFQVQQKFRDYYKKVEQGTDTEAKDLLRYFDSQGDKGEESLLQLLRQDSAKIIREIVQRKEG